MASRQSTLPLWRNTLSFGRCRRKRGSSLSLKISRTFRVRDPKILRSTSVKGQKGLPRIRSQRRPKQQKENQVYEQPKHLFKEDNSTPKKINRPVAIFPSIQTKLTTAIHPGIERLPSKHRSS